MNILPFQSEYVTKGEFYELKQFVDDGFEKVFTNINAVESSLSRKIDAVETSLSRKIDVVELALATKIDASKDEVIRHINSKKNQHA